MALIKQAHPNWTPAQIKTQLLATADDLGLPADSQGAGLVNAVKAVGTTSLAGDLNGDGWVDLTDLRQALSVFDYTKVVADYGH